MNIDKNLLHQIEIVPADMKQFTIINNLCILYAYELSKFGNDHKFWSIPESGIYEPGCSNIKTYFTDPDRKAFLLKHREKPIGFVLLNKAGYYQDVDWNMGEFFVSRRYQGKGIGKFVVEYLFERYPGRWNIAAMINNHPAIKFWESAIPARYQSQIVELEKSIPHKMLVFNFMINQSKKTANRIPFKNIKNKIMLRKATKEDLESIIMMLADDPLGSTRENPLLPLEQSYVNAFNTLLNNPNCELLIAEQNSQVVGVAQVDYLTYLTYQGGKRAQIEGVRVHKNFRSQKIGKLLLETIIERAKMKRCHMVQLTTNKIRTEAMHFYEKLGFKNTHEGLKLILE